MPITTLIGVILLVSFVCIVLILVDNSGESSRNEGPALNLSETAPAIRATKIVPQPPETDYLTEIGLKTNAYKNRAQRRVELLQSLSGIGLWVSASKQSRLLSHR